MEPLRHFALLNELRNHFFCFFGVKLLKFFDEDPGSGMETERIPDPGWKKVGSGTEKKASDDQGVTKRCRLSWLTNSDLGYEHKCSVADPDPEGSKTFGRI